MTASLVVVGRGRLPCEFGRDGVAMTPSVVRPGIMLGGPDAQGGCGRRAGGHRYVVRHTAMPEGGYV